MGGNLGEGRELILLCSRRSSGPSDEQKKEHLIFSLLERGVIVLPLLLLFQVVYNSSKLLPQENLTLYLTPTVIRLSL